MDDRLNNIRGRPSCMFITVFWGDWHRNMFLKINLPTLLAAGNLPAFVGGVACEYLVFTTSADAKIVEQDSAFARLRSLIDVEVKIFAPSKTRHPIDLHRDIWHAATDRAQRQRSLILFMPPDAGWADGSFARLRDKLVAGKRAIFMAYPRVVSDTIVPAMLERHPRSSDEAMTISSRQMMTLAISHIHPLMAVYDRAASHFPIHPEMVLWPIKDDGFLLRFLARELFCFEPGAYPLNKQALLASMPPRADIHVFDDAREFLGVSLTPRWKDMEWYLPRKTLDPLFVGRWWLAFDSPANDYLSSINLRFGCGDVDEAAWRRAERSADALMSHLRSAREFNRILTVLVELNHRRAAQFLASALRMQGLARRWPHREPLVVLAPTDEAFERASFRRIPGDGSSAADTRKTIEAHVAMIPTSGTITEGQVVTTVAGRTLRLTNTSRAASARNNVVLPVEQMQAHEQTDATLRSV
jgi:hypothetical protein